MARGVRHRPAKRNRSHTVCGDTALILPTLGRGERDCQNGEEQFITVEDSMSQVHASSGRLEPASGHVVPCDPLGDRVFGLVEAGSGAPRLDQFGLE
ncbi:hypothetical protein [Streptomyces incanus]|uniref:Uncharacterized protein n=1 Tax=Streptomyces incanus TaxID=887453 RepID=A0ABW0Y3F6_9ACTN